MPDTTHIVTKTFVLNRDGKVLLLVRADDDDYMPGRYDLPGGKVENDESMEVGAARELKEEAGIDVEPTAFHLIYGVTSFDTVKKLNRVKLAFIVNAAEHTIVLSHEHQAHSWESIDEALALLQDTSWGDALRHAKEHGLL